MADRYTKLFSLAPNLYVEESPVVIAAGALLLDNKTNQVLAQLKVRSIGSKAIKAVTVKITPFDTAGRSLGEPVMSQYLDLMVNRDQEFGQKLPIKLPNNATRSFSAAVAEVVFVDNEIWTCSNDDWESLPAAKPLESWLTDRELLKQYKMRYGQDCNYVPEKIRDLWHCTCGATNRNDEDTCYICGKSALTLLSVDVDQLTEEKDARLKIEAEAEAARLKKEAEETKQNRKKMWLISCISLVSLIIIFYSIIIVMYHSAISAIKVGNYVKAYETLISLKWYKDSETKANEIFEKYKIEKIKTADVGDIVYFGSYEQDNDKANGKEDIEWLVLAKEGDKILVISRYVLDCHYYNSLRKEVTWETSSLRTWLNGPFLNSAFSTEEQNSIIKSTITADKNPEYDTLPGSNTRDQVFVLSVIEATHYFKSDKARKCVPTSYAIAQGALEHPVGLCWWLRSPGMQTSTAAVVYKRGYISTLGIYVDLNNGIRPAIWIDIDP